MIAGISPAFAIEPIVVEHSSTLTSSEINSPNANEADAVYDNGATDFTSGFAFVFDGFPAAIQSLADDFILQEETLITDIHMDILDGGVPVDSFVVIIYFDDNGLPGVEVGRSDAIKIDRMDLGDGQSFRYWFDLEDPILLDGGVTYWLEVQADTGDAGWWQTDSIIGNAGVFKNISTSSDWEPFVDLNFVLTSQSTVVGGEIIPIDSTALILAGAQSFSWMIPVVLSILGIGLFVVSRKPENS